MTIFERWLRYPQTVRARRLFFQVHLWTGIGVGLYVLAISISGSAVVFRNELLRKFNYPPPTFTGPGQRLTPEELKQAAQRAFPDFTVARVMEARDPGQAVVVWLERGEERQQRYVHPYTGADLGNSLSLGYRVVTWFIDLHDNLLAGQTGRFFNGIGSIFVTALALTGAVLWWPGLKKWRRSLWLDWKASGWGFHWSLHSMLGFWFVAFVLLWGISGIYLAFPNPFDELVEFLDPVEEASKVPRLGDTALFWLTRLHFGRWGRIPTKVLWTIFGLVPAVLFITGAYMWWNRAVTNSLNNRNEQTRPAPTPAATLEPKTPLTGSPA